jgi:DNA-binding PadR family transcriptional regulator
MIGKEHLMALTPLAVAALALLVERPMHPYEMYQLLLERHEDRLVKVRPGSLYHTVERLQGDQLVTATGTDREGNRPERTTYAITEAGHTALTSRVRELLTQPVREYPHFPHALSEGHNLHADEAVDCLTRYADSLDEEVAELDALLTSVRERGIEEAYWLAGDYLLTMTVAQRDWIRTLINRIDSKDLTWQPHLG